MKRYMIQIQLNGQWINSYLCATRLEAQRKAQYWEGPVRIVLCMR